MFDLAFPYNVVDIMILEFDVVSLERDIMHV